MILITGGTGFIGRALVEWYLKKGRQIRILSRDWIKQRDLQIELNKKFSKQIVRDKIRFFIGDIRDMARLIIALKGVDLVIHTAALKDVAACEYNTSEALKTNIIGTQNILEASLASKVTKAVFLSTDKAVDPINTYGATKLMGEKLWWGGNVLSGGKTKFSIVRYGNVLGSTGSVLAIWDKIPKNELLPITSILMTRFIITREMAVKAIGEVLAQTENIIYKPELQAVGIIELLKAYCTVKNRPPEYKIIGSGRFEKLHEYLSAEECSLNAKRISQRYLISEIEKIYQGET